jgi:hypothetical protein
MSMGCNIGWMRHKHLLFGLTFGEIFAMCFLASNCTMEQSSATHFSCSAQGCSHVADALLCLLVGIASQFSYAKAWIHVVDDDAGRRRWRERGIFSNGVKLNKLRQRIPVNISRLFD